jgi:Tat protein translocase TatB subunit
MPQLSPLEILTVGVIALIVFGPEKLPQIARSIGRTLSELRRMASEVKDEFEAGLRVDDEEDEERPRVHRETRRPDARDERPSTTGNGATPTGPDVDNDGRPEDQTSGGGPASRDVHSDGKTDDESPGGEPPSPEAPSR